MARSGRTAGGTHGGGRPRKKRRLRRFILGSLVVIVLLLVGVVALAPTIASSVAPGAIENALNPKLNGSIDVSDVRVRWMRSSTPVQTATAVIYDEDRKQVARVQIESQFGLLNAVGGIGDLGEFVISGEGDIVRYADGTTNIERVLEPLLSAPSQPAPPSSGGGGNLPPRLRAVVRIDEIKGTYTDQSLATPLRVALESLTGRAEFAVGHPLELELDVAVLAGSTGAGTAGSAPGQRGSLSIEAIVDNLTSATGQMTVASAEADVKIVARDLPLAVADSLGGLGGVLTRAVGERLGFDIAIKGTMDAGTGRVSIATDGGTSLRGAVVMADQVLTTSEPIVFSMDTQRAAQADPAIAAALMGNESATITTLPTLAVTLADLRVALPAAPSGGSTAPLDLRGTSLTLTAALGEVAGTVAVPGQAPKQFRVSPMDVVVATSDLAEGITLATAGQATIDGQAAGTIRADVGVRDILDARGGVRAGAPTVAGEVMVDDFTVAIVQPILDALAPTANLQLTQALGPTLDLRLSVQSESAGGAPLAPGAIPPTTIGLAVDSANVTAGGNLRVATDAIRTLDDQGLWLRVASLVPIAGSMLEPAGVTMQSGGEVTLRVQDVVLIEPMATTPPLDRARARVNFSISETRGQLTMGAAPTNYRIDPGTVSLTVDGAADTIALGGRLDALVTGNGRISTQLDTTLSGLLGQLAGKAQAATSSGQGVRLTATEVGRWLAAVLPAGAPVQVEPGGQITVAITGLGVSAPLAAPAGDVGKAPAGPSLAERLAINLDVTGSGIGFAPVLQAALPGEAPPTPEMIRMGNLAINARLAPSVAPSLTLASAFTAQGQEFSASANMAMQGPLGAGGSIRSMIPRGRFELAQVPIELLRLVPIDLKGDAGQSVNLTALAGEAIGRKVEVVVGLAAPRRGEPAENTTVALRVVGAGGLRLDGGGVVNAEGFSASATTLTARISPRLVQMGLNNFASTMPHKPELMDNATVRVAIEPFTVALDENLAPRPGAMVDVRATVETAMAINNLVLAAPAEGQNPTNAGPVSLEGVRAVASVRVPVGPPAALATSASAPAAGTPAAPSAPSAPPAGAPMGPMTVEFAATAKRPGTGGARLAGITGNASVNAGSVDTRASVADVDLAWLDAALGKPAMLSGALGPTLRADVTFAGDPAKDAQAGLTLAAANLVMPAPARINLAERQITLASPIAATFTASPEWVTRYLFGQSDPGNQMLRATRAIPFSLNVASLTITRGEGRGPLVPGEWGVDATITAPEFAVVLKDGQELRYVSPEVIVRTARNDPRRLNASVRMTEARQIAAATTTGAASGTGGPTPASAAPSQPVPAGSGSPTPPSAPVENIMRVSVMNLMDDAGQINLAGATAEAIGRIPGFPTDLIDAVAKQNGLLVELLGPAVTVDLTARNVPLAFAAPPAAAASGGVPTPGQQSAAPPPPSNPSAALRGRVEADLRSDRATARLAGDINNMVLTTTEPLSISLSEITRAFSEKIAAGMPLVSTFEKPRSLRPATVSGEGITLPMDSNLANLNGRFAIDPGEISFSSSNILGSILKAAGGQASGVAGRRLEPFTFTITSGVINYDRFTLPLGEFTISTRGTVNLVAKDMDLIVYLPVGAVADDALGAFNVGLGTSLSQLAPGYDGSLPFRVRGPIGSAKPVPAVDVFVKEFGSQLTNPGNLLERFLPGRTGGGEEGGGPRLPFFRRP